MFPEDLKAQLKNVHEELAPLERLRTAHGDAAMPKVGLDLVGLTGGAVRPPRVDVSPEGRAAIGEAMQTLGVEIRGT